MLKLYFQTIMTLKDKKNNREYNRKLKAEGATSSNTNKENAKKKETKKEKPSSNFTGVTETAAKLIEDANQRFEDGESSSQVMSYVCFCANVQHFMIFRMIPKGNMLRGTSRVTGPSTTSPPRRRRTRWRARGRGPSLSLS